jgi:hypothetical protein
MNERRAGNSPTQSHKDVPESANTVTRTIPDEDDVSVSAKVPSTSLFDDAFSDRIGKRKSRIPIWLVFFALILVVTMIAFFTRTPLEEQLASRAQDGGSELEAVVEEIRAQPQQGIDEPIPLETPAENEKPQETVGQPDRVSSSSASPASVEDKALREEAVRLSPSAPASEPPPPGHSPADGVGEASTVPPVPARPLSTLSSEGSTVAEPEAEIEPAEPETPDSWIRAYDILRGETLAANRLVDGELPDLDFQEWKVVKETTDELWIDIVANQTSSGRELHFIWSVNRETGQTKPLSQAARDLVKN